MGARLKWRQYTCVGLKKKLINRCERISAAMAKQFALARYISASDTASPGSLSHLFLHRVPSYFSVWYVFS